MQNKNIFGKNKNKKLNFVQNWQTFYVTDDFAVPLVSL